MKLWKWLWKTHGKATRVFVLEACVGIWLSKESHAHTHTRQPPCVHQQCCSSFTPRDPGVCYFVWSGRYDLGIPQSHEAMKVIPTSPGWQLIKSVWGQIDFFTRCGHSLIESMMKEQKNNSQTSLIIVQRIMQKTMTTWNGKILPYVFKIQQRLDILTRHWSWQEQKIFQKHWMKSNFLPERSRNCSKCPK